MFQGRILSDTVKSRHLSSGLYKTQGKTSELLEVSMALPLKWLTEIPTWIKQRPLTIEKLQALEQLHLVQNHLDAQHIEESTSP